MKVIIENAVIELEIGEEPPEGFKRASVRAQKRSIREKKLQRQQLEQEYQRRKQLEVLNDPQPTKEDRRKGYGKH